MFRSCRRGSVSGFAEVEELEWGKAGYEDTVRQLASVPVDWVLAADCCYIDNVGSGVGMVTHWACSGLCMTLVARVVKPWCNDGMGKHTDNCFPLRGLMQEGESPSTPHFIRTCHGLCGDSTRCLVSFELRSNQVGQWLRNVSSLW